MSLALKAARGAAWTILSGAGSRVFGLISTLVLTRYLPPEEYGAVTVAAIIATTASYLTGFGLFDWVVATPKASRSAVFHATFYYIVFGVAAYAVVYVWRDAFGALFNSPNASRYIPGLLLAMLCSRLAFPADRVLLRDLRFGQLSIARGVTELVYAGVSIGLAIAGFGGMAIVYANMAQWSLFCCICLYLADWRDWIEPAKLTWAQTKEIFGFGLPMVLRDIAYQAADSWDNLLISRYFGEATVGRYNLAYKLADLPAQQVSGHLCDVLLPSFARLDPEHSAEGLIRATRLMALIVFPLSIGLSAVAHTVTAAIFDPRWAQMAPMLALFAALFVFRPFCWTISTYQIAVRQPVMVAALGVVKVVVLLGTIVWLAPKGIYWACLAPGAAFAIHAVGGMLAVHFTSGVSFTRLAGGLLPPLFATVPMVGAVLGARFLLRSVGLEASILTLGIEVAVGGVVFLPSAFLFAPSTANDLLRTLLRVMGRGPGEDKD